MDIRMNVVSLTPAQTATRPEPAEPVVRSSESGKEVPAASARPGNPLPVQGGVQGAAKEGAFAAEQGPAPGPGRPEEVNDAVERLNDFVQVVQRGLKFSVDEGTGRTVVKVFDAESEELIRQLPPEEILKLASHMEEMRGLLVKEKA